MKCPHCGGEIDSFTIESRHTHTMIKRQWNELAKAANLPAVRQIHILRFRAWIRRVADDPQFFENVQEAVKRRGEWAREKRIPTFDQAVSPSFLAKLLEGNYDGDPVEERHELIEQILKRRVIGTTTATPAGLEGGAGCETWNEISTERLRGMAE